MKKLAVVLAALMMLSTTTFLAAESPANAAVTTETEGVTVKTAEAVLGQAVSKSEVTSIVTSNTDNVAEEVTPVAYFYLEGEVPANGKVELTVEGVVDGDNVVVLHEYEGVWVNRPATVVNGKVVIDFTGAEHFSPIVIAKVLAASATPDPAPAVNPYYTMNPYGGAKLPKTGAVVVLPVAAMACLAGAVACGRKEK